MIKIDTKELDRFVVDVTKLENKTNEKVKKVLSINALRIEADAKKNLTKNRSVKTGHLRRSIAVQNNGFDVVIHTSNVKYAKGLEFGNKPHIIKPKNKKYLFWKGAKHPVKFVKHPGNDPKPFLIPAFEKGVDKFMEDLNKSIEW